jgi:hypothetical protein
MELDMRRLAIAALFFVASVAAAPTNVPGLSIRGTLTQGPDKKPALETSDHKTISLSGDEGTLKVLNDERLAGSDFEAVGHFSSPDHFEIDPLTSKSMFVYKDGKRFTISYWCDVCYIRTYSPGKCVCCQKYTDLDLQEDKH